MVFFDEVYFGAQTGFLYMGGGLGTCLEGVGGRAKYSLKSSPSPNRGGDRKRVQKRGLNLRHRKVLLAPTPSLLCLPTPSRNF